MYSGESLVRRRRLSEMLSENSDSDKEKHSKFNYSELDSFHSAISPVLILAQFFALMPVAGIRNSDPLSLKFRIKSLGMISTGLFLFIGSFFTLLFSKRLIMMGLTAKNTVGIVFFTCGLSTCISFLFLARKWPDLMKSWITTELIFLFPPYELSKRTLSTKIRLTAVVVMCLALIEHLLFYASNVYNYKMHKKICNISESDGYEFLKEQFSYIYNVIPFSVPLTILILINNFTFTFMWNYMDLFIIMISMGLSIRFKQINNRITSLSGKDVSESIWQEIRHHFVLLCELLELVDRTLSGIILLSSLNNLYFICYQLLNIFNKLRYHINYVYFWFSLLYLVSRTAFLFLCAASINDESTKPLKTLRIIPSGAWCSEIERFIEQVTNQCIALSGMKFFYLTRKLFFGMAGTIVTYELVLLQFDEPNRAKGLTPLCL